MTGPHLTRRGLLVGAGALAGGALLAGPPAVAAPSWPRVPAGRLATRRLEGTDAEVALLPGDATTVLVHVARRFAYEVAVLGAGDAVGWVDEPGRDTGTVLVLLPGRLPRGARELFPPELRVVRDVLADCRGAVHWGGDDLVPQQGLFAVVAGDPRLAEAAAAVSAGPSAGRLVDVLDPARLRAAAALQAAGR